MSAHERQPEGPKSVPREPVEAGEGDLVLRNGAIVRQGSLSFSFVSSQGPGGQNVNKRATKCIVRVHLDELPMGAEQLARLCSQAPSRITDEGELIIAADEYRSQERNRAACLERLRDVLDRAVVAPKPRKKTKPSRGAKERRLTDKRQRSESKKRRRDSDE